MLQSKERQQMHQVKEQKKSVEEAVAYLIINQSLQVNGQCLETQELGLSQHRQASQQAKSPSGNFSQCSSDKQLDP